MGTTDIFCRADRKKNKYSMVGVPQNAMGFQFAHSGMCYAGFFLFSHGDYREYLQTPLRETLQKGKTYFISMYISLADYSQTYIEQIGFCFLQKEEHFETADVLSDLKPVYIKLDGVRNDTAHWHRLTGRYKANGNEKYLLIGSFDAGRIKKAKFTFPKNKGQVKTPINKNSHRDAYYFIDDVSVVEWINPPEDEVKKDSLITISGDTVRPEEPAVLKNIFFKTGSARLEAGSFKELDRLFEVLKVNDKMKAHIEGHTDDSGNAADNRKLSESRARAVANYLTKKGISAKRVSWAGLGDSRPLLANDTEDHKARNRRVEIIFTR
jgi:outer membrane protein OmpA-like peptidoglycan-associated protein